MAIGKKQVTFMLVIGLSMWQLMLSPIIALAGGSVTSVNILGGDCSSVQFVINVDLGVPSGTYTITSSAGLNTGIINTGALATGGNAFTQGFATQPIGTTITVSATAGAVTKTANYVCGDGSSPATEAILDPLGDVDGDGVINRDDNCVRVKNPDQANGWGSILGDVCDTDYYDSLDGVKAFPQTDRTFKVFGNCQNSTCALIAQISPDTLAEILGFPDFRRFNTADGGGWYVDVYFLGTDQNGNKVYQVNVYNALGQLQDDNLLLIVAPDGKTSYRVR